MEFENNGIELVLKLILSQPYSNKNYLERLKMQTLLPCCLLIMLKNLKKFYKGILK